MASDESGYELNDPKHPSYHERMSDYADDRRKAEREQGGGGTRYALVHNASSREQVEALLPGNYEVVAVEFYENKPGDPYYLVAGTDNAGWTLDDYVLPRLASGLVFGDEVFAKHPVVAGHLERTS